MFHKKIDKTASCVLQYFLHKDIMIQPRGVLVRSPRRIGMKDGFSGGRSHRLGPGIRPSR